MNRTQAVQNKAWDGDEWQKFYYRHQQQYIRHRLEAIKLLHQGNNRTQVGEQVGCSYDTLTSWITKYLNGGLSELVRPLRHQKPSRLSVEQQQQLKAMVLTQRPTDYGIERQMWTGAILCEVIAQRFEVQLKDSRIYELLNELGLSYQRAHLRLQECRPTSAEAVGRHSLYIILDNNPTHKQKMQAQLMTHLFQMGLADAITVECLYIPSSKPKLNLVEYVIHLLRLRFLHHLPLGTTLVQIKQQLAQFLASNQFLSTEQVQKTLNFIFSLVA